MVGVDDLHLLLCTGCTQYLEWQHYIWAGTSKEGHSLQNISAQHEHTCAKANHSSTFSVIASSGCVQHTSTVCMLASLGVLQVAALW
jgi:hypothetical protein